MATFSEKCSKFDFGIVSILTICGAASRPREIGHLHNMQGNPEANSTLLPIFYFANFSVAEATQNTGDLVSKKSLPLQQYYAATAVSIFAYLLKAE